ncbi:molecular chaperone [Altererythrobacter aurantiacus]|uniref:Molecular chaperone n=1 Tax=Parapontixanthobacter aurantiacus TaxID=1463599 RepID=A0A844Z9L8_9SPHN|nr:ATP12 family protein [Parapontixanthobacter aurantiacus]MXO84615.1 molecular chaperone [Parapontixanthobacter aurantiacus]
MKRFYKEVGVEEAEGGFVVTLDNRRMKTQGGQAQIVPTDALARLLAGEWAAQGDTLDPKAFPFRDMADYAIDRVSAERDEVIDKLLSYAETDTLCYRAEPGEALFERQEAEWEPVLAAFEKRHAVAFTRISGIVHHAQSEDSLTRLREALAEEDAFALAGLQTMASLAASLCIAMESREADNDAEALWDASTLEERWQVEQWGEDAEARERSDRQRAEFLRAHRFYRAAKAA